MYTKLPEISGGVTFMDVRAMSNSSHRVHMDVQVYFGMCGQNPAVQLKMLGRITAEWLI